MGNSFNRQSLSNFQKSKLLHEFHTFFDLNKDGTLEWKDFNIARDKICEMSGWKIGSENYIHTQELFLNIWRALGDEADENVDGRVSEEEWLKMWERICRLNKEDSSRRQSPKWLDNYIEYKFKLYDRTGDGAIDVDEFEYVLSDFGIPPRDARAAFTMFSEDQALKIDYQYFQQLSNEYFLSENPSDLGNFITGKLNFAT